MALMDIGPGQHPLVEGWDETDDSADVAAREIAQLREAIESRDVIGQAKGMIRLLTGCDAATAFGILAQMSQDTNRKLRDLAELIAETAPTAIPLPADVSSSWRRHTTG